VESKEQALSKAWEMLDEDDNWRKALDYALPWAADGDWEACTVCALAYLYLGESDLCDRWTLKAAEFGARDSWINQQSEYDDFAILISRFDTLTTLGTEELTPLDCQLALERYLLDGSLEFALYYSIKAIRNLWESELVNQDLGNLSAFLVSWIIISKFDSETIATIMENLTTCTTGALSLKEASALVEIIDKSLGN